MTSIQKLRFAYECGEEKADLIYKVKYYRPRDFSLLDDPVYEEICRNLAETEERERQYGFLERIAFGIGYSFARKYQIIS